MLIVYSKGQPEWGSMNIQIQISGHTSERVERGRDRERERERERERDEHDMKDSREFCLRLVTREL